ncbi:MAG: diaminopimelate epimerase [Flavobacteriales bacterium]|nr:diaminopimelate epimerase [Flavobacteriales bacterium]
MFNFFKYQGTGNDFVIFDDPTYPVLDWSKDQIKHLCSRKYGIGADGLIWLKPHDDVDFEMVYYNADGRQSSMCGNGGRCAAFHYLMKNKKEIVVFQAVDGLHEASLCENSEIRLKMSNAVIESKNDDYLIIQTGSPHYVKWFDGALFDHKDFVREAAMVRNSDEFKKDGINVNYVSLLSDSIHVRTFERGVEDETDSCGTGVTACAIATVVSEDSFTPPIHVKTPGGNLSVDWKIIDKNIVHDVYLTGPVDLVFEGEIKI